MKDYPEYENNTAGEGLKALSQLGQELIKENRRMRRGKWLGRLLIGLILVTIFVVPQFVDQNGIGQRVGPHTALIKLEGMVMSGAGVEAGLANKGLRRAFESNQAKGVVLQINSPGGSPVQAERIYNEIARLKAAHPDKKVIAVIEDMGASAAYYIAAAADQIVSAKSSLVGSIGVLMNGFGVVEAMEKLGIERRLITAGENKAILDPFSPQDARDTRLMQEMVDQVHSQFIDAVKQGRGDRLKADPVIFSGMVWNGEEAVKLGVIDSIGSVDSVARDLIGQETLIDYTAQRDWFEEFSGQLGTSIAQSLTQIWSSGAGLR